MGIDKIRIAFRKSYTILFLKILYFYLSVLELYFVFYVHGLQKLVHSLPSLTKFFAGVRFVFAVFVLTIIKKFPENIN